MPQPHYPSIATVVVDEQRDDQYKLDLKPAKLNDGMIYSEQNNAEYCSHCGAEGHDGEQPEFHRAESLPARRICRLRVVNEQAREVKQPGKPGHHEGDMDRLENQVIAAECAHLRGAYTMRGFVRDLLIRPGVTNVTWRTSVWPGLRVT